MLTANMLMILLTFVSQNKYYRLFLSGIYHKKKIYFVILKMLTMMEFSFKVLLLFFSKYCT